MRKITFIILTLLTAVSCVEDFVPDIKESDVRRVVVDAVLTTDTTAHCVRLSASAPYGTPSERIPVISGASVRLSDGTSQIELNEDPGTGCPAFIRILFRVKVKGLSDRKSGAAQKTVP